MFEIIGSITVGILLILFVLAFSHDLILKKQK
jgi:hypothetical protein